MAIRRHDDNSDNGNSKVSQRGKVNRTKTGATTRSPNIEILGLGGRR